METHGTQRQSRNRPRHGVEMRRAVGDGVEASEVDDVEASEVDDGANSTLLGAGMRPSDANAVDCCADDDASARDHV